MARESSGSGFGIPNHCGGSEDIQYMRQMMKCENTTPATTKTDLELMAKNRGNAMLRYKEKKKTRRYRNYSYVVHLFYIWICFQEQYKFMASWNILWTDMISISGTNQGRQELIPGSVWRVDLSRPVKLQSPKFRRFFTVCMYIFVRLH